MEDSLYDDEHPLEVALAWFLAGLIFGVFILVKLTAGKGDMELTKARLNKAQPVPMHYSPESD